MSQLTPQEIVHELDKHIIGQDSAKRSVAIALRNRWRRQQVMDPLRQEITPKNILMIGPTGVGKTEIARRLAKLAGAPFIKVEATKFTEVGYVGRDVDSIIRDLVEAAVKRLREGELDDKEIEIEVAAAHTHMEIFAPPGMEELTTQIQGMFQNLGGERKKTRKLRIREALKIIIDEEASKLVNDEELKLHAVQNVEQNGIVFLDEIDKITSRSESSGADVSRQGVQRDLLPLVEGTTVSTKYGMIKTDHILFIASGAFHLAKPSDLIPELQGRFPIRVELASLSADDFVQILTNTDACLTRQYEALLETEGIKLEFTPDAVKRLAEIAFAVNEKTENIGARRLYTAMEKLLEEVSFEAEKHRDTKVVVDAAYVDARLKTLSQSEDLARYVL